MLLLRVVEMRSRLSCGRGVHPRAPIGGWFSFRPGSVVRGLAFRLPARVVQLVWAHFDVSACAFFAARAKMVGGLGNSQHHRAGFPLHRRTLHSYQLSPSPFAHALSLSLSCALCTDSDEQFQPPPRVTPPQSSGSRHCLSGCALSSAPCMPARLSVDVLHFGLEGITTAWCG